MVRRSVAGVLIKDGRLFLARRMPGGNMGGSWELPGGKNEDGEDDRAALIREWDEEFSLGVRPLRLLGETGFENEGKKYILGAWLIEAEGEPAILNEHDEIRWFSAEELPSLWMADSDRAALEFVAPLLDKADY